MMNAGALRILPVLMLALAFSVVLVEPAAAQSLGGAESILETIVNALTGNIARLIAVIACIIIGFMFLFGYVDLRVVGYFILGAIIVFGAREIVDLLSSG